ncbi:Metallo-dependent phosphatase-like protein [Pisolithus sp. B1]|nr:Metallo-dependent phosphatase-like protein [Pisolithus sp. B1]
MAYDPDKWIAQLMDCQHLPEQDTKILCDNVQAILLEESNIHPVSTPITTGICGDIHSQFWDLLELLRKGGSVPETSYIFMARGLRRLGPLQSRNRTITPNTQSKVTLLRGNHESRQVVRVYGFYDECQQKYGNAAVRKACCSVLDYLNLPAIIEGETLCVHGGLSPDIRTLHQIHVLSRAEIPHKGAYCDPDDIDNWAVSPCSAGWLFRGDVTREFNHVNSLSLIARAHQLVQEGYKYMFDNALVTMWSAPNYCYRCGNMASVLTLREGGEHDFKVFGPAPENDKDKGMGRRIILRQTYIRFCSNLTSSSSVIALDLSVQTGLALLLLQRGIHER